jgi:hypothetical protein
MEKESTGGGQPRKKGRKRNKQTMRANVEAMRGWMAERGFPQATQGKGRTGRIL